MSLYLNFSLTSFQIFEKCLSVSMRTHVRTAAQCDRFLLTGSNVCVNVYQALTVDF